MGSMDAAQAWHDFYVTSGTAAATLVGLLFVGLSLHIRVVVAHAEVRSLARVTLANFFAVLVVSLLLLAPLGDASITGGLLLGAGAFSLLLLVRPAHSGLRGRHAKTLPTRVLLSRFGLSGFCYVLLAVMGALMNAGQVSNGLSGLLGVIMLLLIVAVRNTWDLLVTVADGLRQD